MALNKLLTLLCLFVSFNAFSQERFLAICNDPLPRGYAYENDIRWLKYLFKTTDCDEVRSHLSKLKSFNEFIVPEYIQPIAQYHWSYDLPYLTGITSKVSMEVMPWRKLGFLPEADNVFKHPEMYAEFENLSILDMTTPSNFVIQDVCKIKTILPHIKTLILEGSKLSHIEKNCLNDPEFPWIIASNLNGLNSSKLHQKIIGIYQFVGSLKTLKKFRYLRYLGVDNNTVDNDVSFLAKNLNLTHLNLSMRFGISNISELRQLKNLKSLIITCREKSYDEFFKDTHEKDCETDYLKDLSFLSELPWLESLAIPGNKLEDVTAISTLKNLKYLDLSHNDIKEMPDLSELKELKHFDISKNPVQP